VFYLRKVALASSFTIDRIDLKGRIYERIGGPAYYASLALYMIGLEPLIITSLGNNVKKVRDLLPEYDLLNIVDTDRGCSSIYTFYHRYGENGKRYSEIHKTGCYVGLDKLDREVLNDTDWILVSPVYREIRPEHIAGLVNSKKVALDLQGYSREITDHGVKSSIENLQKRIRMLSGLYIIHLSSDDIQDIASGGDNDLYKVSGLISRALITAYTIGASGGYIYVSRGHSSSYVVGNMIGGVWHYIPAYKEKENGDPTGCGDIFLASMVGYMARGYSIIDSALRASIISGIRVSRGFPISIDHDEIEKIAETLRRSIRRTDI
jgi:sugar/nucleoside kinase (ribokinase family)